MTQKNRAYWEERQIKREAKAFTTIQDIEKEYQIALSKAKQDIIKEIGRITTSYMNDNILNYNEALKHLKGDDYKVWKKDLHDYMKEYNKLLKNAPLQAQKLYLEIETLSAKSRISRLDSLKSQIDMELTKLMFRVENDSINALTSVYKDTFIEVTKDLGINPVVSRDKIKAVLDRPWSGANFSERLWSNTDKLAQTVKQEIVNGMIQGINLKTMTKRVSERFETAKKNDVERLLRTEVNYTLNQATLDGYKEAGIEKYEFSATLDSRTSQICSELHGNIFEIKNIAVGLNYPPMHPRCRSTTIPIIDYDKLIKEGKEELEKNNYTLDDDIKEPLTNDENNSVTEFKKAKTIEEAENYAKNILGLSATNYSNMHVDVANTINFEITKLYDVFKGIDKSGCLKGFTVVKSKDLPSGSLAGYCPSIGTIRIKNVSYKTSLKRMEEKVISSFEKGWCSTSSAEHIIRHELGHSVQHWLADTDMVKLLKIDDLRKEVYNKCELGPWYHGASEEDKKKAGEYLSYYGLMDNGEFIAESVAEYMSGNPRNVAKKVIDILFGKE
nr:MAG TPA: minor capsid protein [Caudoviricetes sp.]